MFAGIVHLDKSRGIGAREKMELRSALSRHPRQVVREFSLANAHFVYASTGALSDYSGFRTSGSDHGSWLAGEPLLSLGGPEADHETLDRALQDRNPAVFKKTRGVFCIIRYSESPEPRLELAGDKLGVRPLYYRVQNGTVSFSTTLRVLEELSFLNLRRDMRGVSEALAFGSPLGRRTIYADVKVLREAEIVDISAGAVRTSHYSRWDRISPGNPDHQEGVSELSRLFREAVEIRLRGDEEAIAFLSGGMDSRAIVSVLVGLGTRVQAINFAPPSSQDQAFAREFAARVSCKYLEVTRRDTDSLSFRRTLAQLVREEIDAGRLSATRPGAVWSGDGGSVGLGNVYLDDQMVGSMRAGHTAEAIERFRTVNYVKLPFNLLRPRERSEIQHWLEEGMREELERLDCSDRGQALYLFLLLNDQRRHLSDVFEEIDHHRLEYQLPFFDSEVLEFVCTLPLDWRMNHGLYSDWFNVLGPEVSAVPWQTYPGHLPCPLPIPAGLRHQADPPPRNLTRRLRRRASAGLETLGILLSGRSLGPISRSRLWVVSALQLLGIRDYRYVLKHVRAFAQDNRQS
jgi:hypothetical protein